MRYLKVLGLVALFFFSMLFFVQNNEVLMQELALGLKVFGWDYQSQAVPFYLLILVSFVLGSVLCTLYFFLERARLSKLCKQLRKNVQCLEQEIQKLKPQLVDSPQQIEETPEADQD